MELFIPEHYDPRLSIRETQDAIKCIRYIPERDGTGNAPGRISLLLLENAAAVSMTTLNGTERPWHLICLGLGKPWRVVHSLAKWKRMALKEYGSAGRNLYTNMNAIRRG